MAEIAGAVSGLSDTPTAFLIQLTVATGLSEVLCEFARVLTSSMI
jgi:hypothetical protein